MISLQIAFIFYAPAVLNLFVVCKSSEPESPYDNTYYDNLYTRLKGNDFGFACFGEPCDDLSLEELEGFIDLRVLILKDQEENEVILQSVKDHLKPKLKYFYDRLKLHCDSRKFQVCHKRLRTCACPHSSMESAGNGTCGFSVGKRCDFSQEKLISFGILLPHSGKANVTCVGNAECVTSFGAAKQICRCPIGFFGPQCKQSALNPWRQSNTPQHGRSFGSTGPTSNGTNVSVWETGDISALLFPADVKKELLKLMTLRGLFDPSERVKEADELYAKMDADADKEHFVIRDIFIRHNSNLSFGMPCDPAKQTILDNPPLAVNGDNWIDPTPADVKKWQVSLLQDSQRMCSFIGYLRCDAAKKVCECKEGLEYNPLQQECQLKINSNCGADYTGAFEFDPLRNLKRFSPPYSPSCGPGTSCVAIPLFFTKQCKCDGGANVKCDSQAEHDLLQKLFNQVSDRSVLQLGNDCDPVRHEALLNPQDAARTNYTVRLDQLQQLFATTGLQFCALHNHLWCNEATKKCECFKELIEQGGQCEIQNFDNCEDAYVIGEDFYKPNGNKEGVKLWKVEEVFAPGKFTPPCVSNSTCDTETSKCACTNGKAGEKCDDDLSEFAKVLSRYRIQGYNDDNAINEVFHKLNLNTGRIEKLMVLNYTQTCSTDLGERLDRIVKFYRQVGHSDDNIGGTKMLHEYNKRNLWAMELMGRIMNAQFSPLELCNAFLGLTCHHTGMCRCRPGTTYEDNKCRINPGEECDEHPAADWMLRCRSNSVCVPSGFNFKSVCVCVDGWTGEFCQERDEQLTDEPTTPTRPSVGESEGTTELTTVYFEPMSRMMDEIINHRRFMLDEKCYYYHEILLTEYFPRLPRWNLEIYTTLPQGPLKSFYILSQVYNAGYQFCSRRDYMACVGGWCGCNSELNLVQVGEECRLKEYAHCGASNGIFDPKYPIPLCVSGTVCSQFDHGAFQCLKPQNN